MPEKTACPRGYDTTVNLMTDHRVSQTDFREALSCTAATVSVVTTDGPDGRAGLTVSSMCSVSDDPPSVLVCVNQASGVCDLIRNNGVICINVLRVGHSSIADGFSGRVADSSRDPFDYADWDTLVTGAPAMLQALVSLDCRIKQELRYGTHYVFVAEVEGLSLNTPGKPLVYNARTYQPLGNSESLSLEEVEYSAERYT